MTALLIGYTFGVASAFAAVALYLALRMGGAQ